MICPNCRTDNRDGAKYCDECGFPLAGKIAALTNAAFGDEPVDEVLAKPLPATRNRTAAPLIWQSILQPKVPGRALRVL